METPVCPQWPGPGEDIPNQNIELNWLTGCLSKSTTSEYPPHMYDDVKAHLQEMLDIDAIWKLHNPWASVAVLVQKKDRSWRFCINNRKLNNLTFKDAYSLPYIHETLNSLQGPSGSPCLTWSLGTGRSRWMMRANHWPCSWCSCWDSMSVTECLSDWPMLLPPFSGWWKPASGTSILSGA